jgi:hypothetical protein
MKMMNKYVFNFGIISIIEVDKVTGSKMQSLMRITKVKSMLVVSLRESGWVENTYQ